MKQLGNLAIICAQRPEVLLQVHNGNVAVYVGEGQERSVLSAGCGDEAGIDCIIYELNFGKFRREVS